MDEVLKELNAIEKEIGSTRFSDMAPDSLESTQDRLSNLEGVVRQIIGLMKQACTEHEG